MKKKRIVIAGGSGFIGTALAHDWYSQNGEVVVLTRKPQASKNGVIEVEWSGEHMGEWMQYLDGAEAIINLTGKNISCPHTPENVRELTESRVKSVRAIALALGHVQTPPRVWLQAGSVGYYGNSKDRICDEGALNGGGAMADICRQWESAFNTVQPPKTRKVLLRIGFVLGRYGGGMPVLTKLAKCFLGGQAGDGQQFMSWIHLEDLMRMFWGCMDQNDLTGTFNAVGPNPARNEEFMRELRQVLNRPWCPPAPEWAVRLGAKLMDTDPSLALNSYRATPKRFLEAGFQFDHPDLPAALKNVFSPSYANK